MLEVASASARRKSLAQFLVADFEDALGSSPHDLRALLTRDDGIGFDAREQRLGLRARLRPFDCARD